MVSTYFATRDKGDGNSTLFIQLEATFGAFAALRTDGSVARSLSWNLFTFDKLSWFKDLRDQGQGNLSCHGRYK